MDPRIRPHGAAHARHRGQLLSHRAGLPEDNPWGDQELDASEAARNEWLRAGIPFSTAPDTRYEYSSYAFGLLGRIPPALALTSPDLPGCVAAATTLADARQLIEGMRMNGDTVPPPTLHIKEIDFAV